MTNVERFGLACSTGKKMQAAGASLATTVHKAECNWRAVSKWARLDALPERRIMAPKLSTPDLFQDHLARRWSEGCTTGRHLLPEIKRLGYTGSLSHLERLLSKWRSSDGIRIIPTPIVASIAFTAPAAMARVIPPNLAAALCMKPRDLLTQQQAKKVDRLKTECIDFTTMRQLATWFRGLLRSGDVGKFERWLRDAHSSEIYGFRRFAHAATRSRSGEERNYRAVAHWSEGGPGQPSHDIKTLDV